MKTIILLEVMALLIIQMVMMAFPAIIPITPTLVRPVMGAMVGVILMESVVMVVMEGWAKIVRMEGTVGGVEMVVSVSTQETGGTEEMPRMVVTGATEGQEEPVGRLKKIQVVMKGAEEMVARER